jgi:hypothetical protein
MALERFEYGADDFCRMQPHVVALGRLKRHF